MHAVRRCAALPRAEHSPRRDAGPFGALAAFAPNVLREPGIATAVRTLHEAIYGAVPGRKALLAGLLEALSSRYGERTGGTPHRDEVERAREYIERNFAGHVTLDAICRAAGLASPRCCGRLQSLWA